MVPVDGSNQSEKALEYAVKTLSTYIDDFDDDHATNKINRMTEFVILHVLPQFSVPLGFDRPMRSLKTGQVVSLTDYINEMNEIIIHEWENNLSSYGKKYESKYTLIQTRLVVHSGSIAGITIDFADKEKINLIVVGNVGLGGILKLKTLGGCFKKCF